MELMLAATNTHSRCLHHLVLWCASFVVTGHMCSRPHPSMMPPRSLPPELLRLLRPRGAREPEPSAARPAGARQPQPQPQPPGPLHTGAKTPADTGRQQPYTWGGLQGSADTGRQRPRTGCKIATDGGGGKKRHPLPSPLGGRFGAARLVNYCPSSLSMHSICMQHQVIGFASLAAMEK
jgi:hypothetical protein